MRFTIRELMILTAMLALALGWWLDRWQLKNAELALREAYMQLAIARTEASYQELSSKQALEKTEAKLNAAEQGGNSD